MFRPIRLLLSIALNLGLLLAGVAMEEPANPANGGIYLEPVVDEAGRQIVVRTIEGDAALYRVMTKHGATDTVNTVEGGQLLLVRTDSVNEQTCTGVNSMTDRSTEMEDKQK